MMGLLLDSYEREANPHSIRNMSVEIVNFKEVPQI